MTGNLGRRLYGFHFWEAAVYSMRGVRSARRLPSSSLNYAQAFSRNQTRTYSARRISPRQVSQRFASGGFFILGASPSSSAAVETGSTTCAAMNPEKLINTYDKTLIRSLLASGGLRRSLHTSRDQAEKNPQQDHHNNNSDEMMPARAKDIPPPPPEKPSSNRHLMDRLAHMPQLHRPTKEELLAAANGFWSRLKVRFKWFSIRSVRPFNFDEIAALFSWVLLGHIVWVVLGTTTFFSLVIFAINTVFAQGKRERNSINNMPMLILLEKRWPDGLATTLPNRPG